MHMQDKIKMAKQHRMWFLQNEELGNHTAIRVPIYDEGLSHPFLPCAEPLAFQDKWPMVLVY